MADVQSESNTAPVFAARTLFVLAVIAGGYFLYSSGFFDEYKSAYSSAEISNSQPVPTLILPVSQPSSLPAGE